MTVALALLVPPGFDLRAGRLQLEGVIGARLKGRNVDRLRGHYFALSVQELERDLQRRIRELAFRAGRQLLIAAARGRRGRRAGGPTPGDEDGRIRQWVIIGEEAPERGVLVPRLEAAHGDLDRHDG